jgi:hypothetical protein
MVFTFSDIFPELMGTVFNLKPRIWRNILISQGVPENNCAFVESPSFGDASIKPKDRD